MKEEALKLAHELEKPVQVPNQPEMIYIDGHRMYASQMIRRLVEELDAKDKLIESVKVGILTRAVLDERHGIK